MRASPLYAVAASTGALLVGVLAGCGETPTDVGLERLALDQTREEFLVAEAFPQPWDLACVLFHYQDAAKQVEKRFGSGWKADDGRNFYSGDHLSLVLLEFGTKKFEGKSVIVGPTFMGISEAVGKIDNSCVPRNAAYFRKTNPLNRGSMYLMLDRKIHDQKT